MVGSIAAEQVPGEGHLLQLVTAGLLGLSSYRMGRHAAARCRPEEPLAETDAPEAPAEAPTGRPRGRAATVARYASIGVVAGLLSGLLGIGGGVIMVPAFVQLARIEVKAAVATSLVCVGAFAVPGHDHPRPARATSTGGWRSRSSSASSPAPVSAPPSTIRATDRRLRLTVASRSSA